MSEINKLKKQADKVYAKMENMQRLSDSELKAKTDEFKMRLANGEQRVWVECEVEDYDTYNRPESQGGTWILAQRMKINRELTEDEVAAIIGGVAA